MAAATSSSIHFMTRIGPGTIVSMASRTAATVAVKSSFSTSSPFSFKASRMYDRFEKGLAL